jgi:serine/threonine protein kinase
MMMTNHNQQIDGGIPPTTPAHPPPPPPHRPTSNYPAFTPMNISLSSSRTTPPPPPPPPPPPTAATASAASIVTQSLSQPASQNSSIQPRISQPPTQQHNPSQQVPQVPVQNPHSNQHHHQNPHSHQQHGNVNGRTPALEKLPPGTILTVGKHQVTIVKYLSAGGFAHIYVVKTDPMEQGTDIACLKRVIVPNKEGLNQLRAEVEVMQRLSKAENVVKYYDSNASRLANSPGSYEVLVLMELCSNKSLLDFMNSRLKTKLSTNEILKIMLDISKAVYNMHFMKLIHRDIKIENVLLDEHYNFKLADFGSTCPILRVPRNHQEFQILHNDILMQTTPQYRSPEMIDLYRGLPIDEKSDIWALGVFLYKLCYYTTPFEIPGELGILHSAYNFPAQPQFPKSLKQLINIMLQENPIFRPNIYQVLIEVCKLSGFNSDSISKITDVYKDFYGLGNYQYPSNEQIHPAIEPFTPSFIPMFSPFKAPPRDPLEVQMEIKMMQQQQQQQQEVKQQAQQTPALQVESHESASVTTSSINEEPSSTMTKHSRESGTSISAIEEADPFSIHNLNKSTTSGSNKSIPPFFSINNNHKNSSSSSNSNNNLVDKKVDSSQESQINLNEINEFGIINAYNNESTSRVNSNPIITNNINNKNESLSVNDDNDLNIENVESRFPEVALPSVRIQPPIIINKLNNSIPNVNNDDGNNTENNINNKTTNDLLHLSSGTIKRSKSVKRYSVHNPFPTNDGINIEKTGDSIISFDDIKKDLIELETVENNNLKFPTSRSALSLQGGYRRLSSEQLSQEVINFSEEEDKE